MFLFKRLFFRFHVDLLGTTPYSCFGRCDDDAYSAGDQQIPLWSSQRHLELAVFSCRLLNYKIHIFWRIHVYVVWMYIYI